MCTVAMTVRGLLCHPLTLEHLLHALQGAPSDSTGAATAGEPPRSYSGAGYSPGRRCIERRRSMLRVCSWGLPSSEPCAVLTSVTPVGGRCIAAVRCGCASTSSVRVLCVLLCCWYAAVWGSRGGLVAAGASPLRRQHLGSADLHGVCMSCCC